MFPRTKARFAAVAIAALLPASLSAQDYIFKPGPRGFDPRLNRYGTTEMTPPAQTTAPARAAPSKTTVNIDILLPQNGAGLDAQQWSRVLGELGYSVRMRSPILDDKPEIKESTRGPLRFVTVIGGMDQHGNLIFPGKTFSPSQAGALGDWLTELKTYGAQGSPEGEPLWGLSRPQFEAVYRSLAAPVKVNTQGLTFAETIRELALPAAHPLNFSAEAKAALNEPGLATRRVQQSAAGLTTGTTLAYTLAQFGLGFLPNRTPSGEIELRVIPLPVPVPGAAEKGNAMPVWPVGWEIEPEEIPERGSRPVRDDDALPPNRVQMAAPLFQMQEIYIPKSPLSKVLSDVEQQTGVPVLVDGHALAAVGTDVSALSVDFGPRRASWSMALKSLTFPHRLRPHLRRDESGQPLVWVTPLRGF